MRLGNGGDRLGVGIHEVGAAAPVNVQVDVTRGDITVDQILMLTGMILRVVERRRLLFQVPQARNLAAFVCQEAVLHDPVGENQATFQPGFHRNDLRWEGKARFWLNK